MSFVKYFLSISEVHEKREIQNEGRCERATMCMRCILTIHVRACVGTGSLLDEIPWWNCPLTFLLEQGDLVNARDEKGKGALLHAARAGNPERVRVLAKRGADVHARDDSGWTTVHHAADMGSPEAMVELGTDVDARGMFGWILLLRAVDGGSPEVVRALVELGTDVDARGMLGWTHAAAVGSPEVVRALVELGTDVDARGMLGWTPLHRAVDGGSLEIGCRW